MSEPDTAAANTQPPGDGAARDTAEAADRVLEDLEALRGRLQAAEQDRDKYLDLATRTKADFENYQKRMQRDLAAERRYAQAPLAADLLSALDNLERATAAAEKAGEKGPLVQGVALVHTQLLDVLRRHGVTRIDAQGQPFDPNRHQAVLQQPAKDCPPMTVVQVLEHGYMIHDRVLRPARVAVSTAPAEGG
jgi:molecular chaperone GrpE